MELVFWIGVIGSVYSYFLYPVILFALLPLSRLASVPNRKIKPRNICVIITAFNEESRIREKLENTLRASRQDLNVQIIVSSDGSTDGTHEIVQEYFDRGVKLVVSPGRNGKEAAQLVAIEKSVGDILVFTDVATVLMPQSLINIISNFADPSIGAVSSTDRFVSRDGKIVGEGAYVRYEMWLRGLESQVNSLVGLSGSFFAVRRSVCEGWDIMVPSDFGAAINCKRDGLRAVIDPSSVGLYPDIENSNQEYSRKLRTILRGMNGLCRKLEILNPIRYGFFSFQVWSHKVMRWAVPWFMALVFFANLWLLGEGAVYVLALVVQILFYMLAELPRIWRRAHKIPLMRLANFFLESNIATAHAAVLATRGKKVATWQPSIR